MLVCQILCQILLQRLGFTSIHNKTQKACGFNRVRGFVMKQNSGKLPATELCCEKEEKHFKCVKVPEVEIEMA